MNFTVLHEGKYLENYSKCYYNNIYSFLIYGIYFYERLFDMHVYQHPLRRNSFVFSHARCHTPHFYAFFPPEHNFQWSLYLQIKQLDIVALINSSYNDGTNSRGWLFHSFFMAIEFLSVIFAPICYFHLKWCNKDNISQTETV